VVSVASSAETRRPAPTIPWQSEGDPRGSWVGAMGMRAQVVLGAFCLDQNASSVRAPTRRGAGQATLFVNRDIPANERNTAHVKKGLRIVPRPWKDWRHAPNGPGQSVRGSMMSRSRIDDN